MRFLLIFCTVLCIGNHASADQAALKKLSDANEAKAWMSVGLINIKNAGFCTGTLIANDLVLTAAHCVHHPKTGDLLEPTMIDFLAGWRSGRAAAHRKARRIVVHENYNAKRHIQVDKVVHDLAVIELERPITLNLIRAFELYKGSTVDDNVKVVSYAKNRSEAPSIEEECKVIDHDPRALVLTCDVDFGASGSPVFVVEGGVPKLASIISAKAIVDNQKVALGVSLGDPLKELIYQIRPEQGIFEILEIEPVLHDNNANTQN